MTGTDRKTLLMVDDDAEMCRFVARVAEAMNYAVEFCTEADGFLAALERGDPDVILLDLAMPDTDGIELLRHLSRQHTRATVFIVSGFDPAIRDMALRLGAAGNLAMGGIIPKPIRAAELRALLAKPLGTTGD
ncbi:MAG TPA: response regulator [Alphaproteobacteria bacterium]|jgi:CheY-like chemotaxis protein|nr:response regulator [Alphaproteobacteria bacterium]